MNRSLDTHTPVLVAAVEGGGTTFRVAVAALPANHNNGKHEILHRIEVDSSDNPQEALLKCADFLKTHKPHGGYHALGVASFGPVGLNPSRDDYGCILSTTPKEKWRGVNLLEPLIQACMGDRSLAVQIETDVNAPALAEYEELHKHQQKQLTSVAYVTVGTGVGVGLVIHGKCVHGRMHPEGGHVCVQPLEGDVFEGYSWGEKCPYGGKRTVEGIASSVALTERLEQQQNASSSSLARSVLSELGDNDPVWDHAANAIANLCVTLILTTSMERIVLGGGVMKRNGLLEKIQKQTVHLLNGYLELPQDMSELITLSTWGHDAGLVGAVVLAKRAYQEDEEQRKETELNDVRMGMAFLRGALAGSLFVGLAMSLWRRRR